jgi:CHAT domain-containing protein/tetratricopeptide (TPR) repeat protein
MKGLLVSLCVPALPLALPAQELPKPTEEGMKAAKELLVAFGKAGALKVGKDPRTGALRTVVADEGKLKEAARKLREKFTPAARDFLLRGHEDPGAVALLLELGQQARDDRALAFGRLFSGRLLGQRLQFQRARQEFEQAVKLFERIGVKDWQATSLSNLAAVCRDQGDLPRARKYSERALELRKQLFGERHPAVATSLNNLALVCRDQGDLPEARRLHERALALRKELHGERHPDVAVSLNNLALVCGTQGDTEQALLYLRRAALACRLPQVTSQELADLRPEDLRRDPVTLHILNEHGWASRSLGRGAGRLREASHAYALAAGVLDRFRADERTSPDGKLDQGSRRAALVPARVGLASELFRHGGKAEDLHVAFTAVEQGRGRVFLEAVARARAHQVGGVPEKLRAQEFDLGSHLRGLDAAIARENAKTLDKRNATLVKDLYEQREKKQKELDAFADRLRKTYPQYAALQHPKPCTLQQARDCLADNEVAVLFALDRKDSYALVVHKKPAPGDKGRGVAVVRLPGSDVLAPLVATLTDEDVLKSDGRCRALGSRLHALLLKPLEKHLKGKDLVLAPDGVLWQLPFELLVEGRTADDDGRYLAETRQIRYTPSLTVLHLIGLWEETRKAPAEPLWALGDPVFSKDDRRGTGDLHAETAGLLARYARRRRGGTAWARLPATGAEVRAIAGLHGAPKDDVVTDARACEKVVKAASDRAVLSRKRYVHLATHGILGSALGRPPSLVLSLVGNDGKVELGGANDGFLTMQEVTHLKLNADLVVLSACQSARGEVVPGEGVMGLTRAFLYAGSRGVVCSLWSVDDERTADLMKAMYAELKKGKGAAEALALARRKLIAEEQAPFYWAPFILIGR